MENQSQPTPPTPSSSGSPKKSNTTLIIVIVVILAVLVGGYFIYRAVATKLSEKAVEKMIELQTGQKVDIDKDGNTVKIKGEEGEFEFNIEEGEDGTFSMKFTDEEGKEGEFKVESNEDGLDVPDELKKSLPIFEPSKMITLNDIGDLGMMGTFSSSKSKEDVKKYYLKEMADASWKKQGEFSAEETTSLSYTKSEQTASIIIFEQDNETHFTLSFSK